MMYYMKQFSRCLLLLLIIAGPLALVRYKREFLAPSTFFELLRTYLPTTAFVGALWAVHLKDSRLRSGSEYVLISLFSFVLIVAIASVGATLQIINEPKLQPLASYFSYLALILYVVSMCSLVLTGVLQTTPTLRKIRGAVDQNQGPPRRRRTRTRTSHPQ